MADQPNTDRPGDEGDLPLEDMAVMQEPPFDPEDKPPSGIMPSLEPHKTHPRITERNVFQWGGLSVTALGIYGAALAITVLAGIVYLQQGSAPAPQPTADESSGIVATSIPVATSVPTVPTALPTVP